LRFDYFLLYILEGEIDGEMSLAELIDLFILDLGYGEGVMS